MLHVAARVLWRLISACLNHCDKASGHGVGRKTFQGGSCKTVQGGPKENPQVVPAGRFFGGRPDRFIDVMAFYYTCFLVLHVRSDIVRWASKRKWASYNN